MYSTHTPLPHHFPHLLSIILQKKGGGYKHEGEGGDKEGGQDNGEGGQDKCDGTNGMEGGCEYCTSFILFLIFIKLK